MDKSTESNPGMRLAINKRICLQLSRAEVAAAVGLATITVASCAILVAKLSTMKNT